MRRFAIVVATVVVTVAGCSTSTPTTGPPPPTTKAALNVDVTAPLPALTPWAPSFNPRRVRGLVDEAPRALRGGRDVPDDDDLPFSLLYDAGSRGHLVVDGAVVAAAGVVGVAVTLDTAAERTVVAPALARRFGLTPTGTRTMRDASGDDVTAGEVVLPDVVVAGVRFTAITALVPTTALRDDLFLLGADALRHVDVVVDGPLGAVALLAAGTALNDEQLAEADVVELDVAERFTVSASATGGDGPITFDLVIDTGSPLTSVPAAIGVAGLLPADTSTTVTVKGASGLANQRRGRFILRPLSLGLVQVGDVSALEVGDGVGVVGNDVLGRGRVVISAARRALAFLPSMASSGDRLLDGKPVLRVRPHAVDGDFFLEVDPPLSATGVRFLLRSHDRQTGAPRGGAVEVVVVGSYNGRLETGLPFGTGPFSVLVLPRSLAPCLNVCLKLLGTWPAPKP